MIGEGTAMDLACALAYRHDLEEFRQQRQFVFILHIEMTDKIRADAEEAHPEDFAYFADHC